MGLGKLGVWGPSQGVPHRRALGSLGLGAVLWPIFPPCSSFPLLSCLLKAYSPIYSYRTPLSMELLEVPYNCPPNPSHPSRGLSSNLLHPTTTPSLGLTLGNRAPHPGLGTRFEANARLAALAHPSSPGEKRVL